MNKKTSVNSNRRRLLGTLGALGTMASLPQIARGQGTGGFPARSITLYCPWTAGSNTDLLLRQLAESATRELGGRQRILVEVKPGAGGALGAARRRRPKLQGPQAGTSWR